MSQNPESNDILWKSTVPGVARCTISGRSLDIATPRSARVVVFAKAQAIPTADQGHRADRRSSCLSGHAGNCYQNEFKTTESDRTDEMITSTVNDSEKQDAVTQRTGETKK